MLARINPIALAAFLCLAACCGARAFEFKQCDRAGAKLISAEVSACPSASGAYCTLKRDVPVNYQVNFTTAQPFEEAELRMTFNLAGMVTSACELGVECPSTANQLQRLNVTSSLLKEMPAGRDFYNIEVIDQSNTLVFCVQFPARVI